MIRALFLLAFVGCAGREIVPGFYFEDPGFDPYLEEVPALIEAQAYVFDDPGWPSRVYALEIQIRTRPGTFVVLGQEVSGTTQFDKAEEPVYLTLQSSPESMGTIVETPFGHELTHVWYCLRGDCDHDHVGPLWVRQKDVYCAFYGMTRRHNTLCD